MTTVCFTFAYNMSSLEIQFPICAALYVMAISFVVSPFSICGVAKLRKRVEEKRIYKSISILLSCTGLIANIVIATMAVCIIAWSYLITSVEQSSDHEKEFRLYSKYLYCFSSVSILLAVCSTKRAIKQANFRQMFKRERLNLNEKFDEFNKQTLRRKVLRRTAYITSSIPIDLDISVSRVLPMVAQDNSPNTTYVLGIDYISGNHSVTKDPNFVPTDSCGVCLEKFDLPDEEEEIVGLLECTHLFHIDCIQGWLCESLTCPQCKNNISIHNSTASSSFYNSMCKTQRTDRDLHFTTELNL